MQSHLDHLESLQRSNVLLFVALLQVASFWGVAPLWLSLFVGVIVLASKYLSWVRTNMGRRLLVVVGLVWFFLYYKASLTIEMAACFLWLSLSFKLLELKTRKDFLTYIFTAFYLCAATLLFNQSILQLLIQLGTIGLGLYVLLRLNGGNIDSLKEHRGVLLKVMGLAIPLVLVLFLFFPRLAPLWSIPVKGSQAQSGVSDTMTPGDIAKVVNSDARAFRATFSGDIPPQDQLYWRGIVLDSFDGRTWSRSEKDPLRFAKHDQGRDLKSDLEFYEVLLEPHNQKWLFTLADSKRLSSHVVRREMGLHGLAFDALQSTRYKMSVPEFDYDTRAEVPTAHKLGNAQRITALKQDLLFPGGNERTRAFVDDLVAQSSSQQEVVFKLMRMFQSQPFAYTLKPPTYGQNFVDDFLFGEQRGFCAHFSGSLAFMLRVAGIPARVVVGYQGGERINDNEYVLVRQYDAHAWVEANIYGLGWVRLDPTAMVAPDRVEANLAEAVSEEGSFLSGNTGAFLRHNLRLLSWLSLTADQLNFQWQKWVVNYSQDRQSSLFKDLFGSSSLTYAMYVLGAVFIVVSVLAVLYLGAFRSSSIKRSKAQKKYLRWLILMAWFGYRRQVGEAPRQYLSRIEGQAPNWLYRLISSATAKFERSEYEIN